MLIVGVLPTLIALFYAHSRWVRLVGFWGCWLGGTVILSSLHGVSLSPVFVNFHEKKCYRNKNVDLIFSLFIRFLRSCYVALPLPFS